MAQAAEYVTGDSGVRERLLDGVQRISPLLAAQVADEEQAGELSRQSSDALYEAGLLQMKLPAVLGGAEADLVSQFLVIEAVARVNPAAAWCLMVGATSLGMPGAFLPDKGIEDMFADGEIPRGAILIMPSGRATPVTGGYQLGGRWAFASGVQHAQWVAVHAMVASADGAAPVLHMLVIPADVLTLHNNWQVLGLRGTGSCDVSVEDVFVPEGRAWPVPGAQPRRGGPLYTLGIPAFVAYEHAAFAIGLARRALDALTELAMNKKRGYGPDARTLADRETVQRAVGRGELAWRAARALAIELNAQAMATVDAGGVPDAGQSLELRAIATYCTEVAADIIGDAFRHAGAGAIYEGQVIQACLRDINVAAQHLMVSDTAYELLGKTRLGFDDVLPMA